MGKHAKALEERVSEIPHGGNTVPSSDPCGKSGAQSAPIENPSDVAESGDRMCGAHQKVVEAQKRKAQAYQ